MTQKEIEANYYKEADRKQMELAKKKSQRRSRWWLACQAIVLSAVVFCFEYFDWNSLIGGVVIAIVVFVTLLPFAIDAKGGAVGKTKKNQQTIDSTPVVPNYTNHS